jgi:RNA polymerase sigma-70 factor (ECF subfamily)
MLLTVPAGGCTLWRGEGMSQDQSHAIEQHIPALRRYARALVRDADKADDLVQDCLERSVSRFGQFTPGTNLRTWLFTIMHNLHCDATAVEIREFEAAFARLAKRDQHLLLLVGVEGFSYEEVAEVLGIAVGTVKSRLFRARERLRALQGETAVPTETPPIRVAIGVR